MALTKRRANKIVRAQQLELLSTAETVYEGGVACFDTSTGLVKKGATSTTLVPIGVYAEDKVVGSGGTVIVKLFREFVGMWMINSGSDAVDANDCGKDCFLVDDNTVSETNAGGNTQSVAGKVWKVDATKGVLVEFQLPTGG